MRLVTAGLLAFAAGGCAPLSHFEDAPALARGEREVTVGWGSTRMLGLGSDAPLVEEASVRLRWGMSRPNADFRLRLTVVDYDGGFATIVGFGPKFATPDGKAAFLLGVDVVSAEGETLPVLAPAVLLTAPIRERTDLTLALRSATTPWGPISFGASGGLGIELDENRWRVRPEAGVTTVGSGGLWHVGLALSYRDAR